MTSEYFFAAGFSLLIGIYICTTQKPTIRWCRIFSTKIVIQCVSQTVIWKQHPDRKIIAPLRWDTTKRFLK